MPTRILIVDDSRIFRSLIEDSLASADDIHVIGSVWNGQKAMEFLETNQTDVVTLDVEMPTMDGLETLKAIQKFNQEKVASPPVGVIMVSSLTVKGADITIKALEMGAFDFITKPQGLDLKKNIENLRRQLLLKIRYYTSRNKNLAPIKPLRPLTARPLATPSVSSPSIKAIVIGVSTGGPRALAKILPELCEETDVPIFIAQHMPPTFTQSLAKSLDAKCRSTVIESKTDEPVQNNYVYIAPGGKHMLLRSKNSQVYTIINNMPPEKGYRPSVDILFRSAALVYGRHTIGVVLTGMGVDGTKGAGILKRAGATVLIQDEATSVVWGMPGSVKSSGYVDQELPLEKIPEAIGAILRKTI